MGVGPRPGECNCKFRLGLGGRSFTNEADVTVIDNGVETPRSGFINFTAVQCFTGAAKCNPAVNNFVINFKDGGNTINFRRGRRGEISCVDSTVATLTGGTAQGSGNAIPKKTYIVSFTYTISGGTASVSIDAVSVDGLTEFHTDFTAPVSSQTFIGDCTDTVGP